MFYISLLCAKLYYQLQKLFHKEKSDRSGMLALRLCPDFLSKISKPPIVIAVTGTNGKTTTCNFLADMLKAMGYTVAINNEGANLKPGLSKALMSFVSLTNKTKADYFIAEFDEITTDELLAAIQPDYVLVTNLFRDSMKRNGHTDYVFSMIERGLQPKFKLILNANDPISSQLGKNNPRIYYGIDKLQGLPTADESIVSDIRICPYCCTELIYDYRLYHHLGMVHCPNCGFQTPLADYLLTEISTETIRIKHKDNLEIYPLIASSLFNIFNSLAAITLFRELSFSTAEITSSLSNLQIVSSRYTSVTVNDMEIITQMSKGQNPIATSRVFDFVRKSPGKKEVILIVDDIYDRAISSETMAWIYDSDFEFLNDDSIERIIVGGVRHLDYRLRLLVAKVEPEKIFTTVQESDTVNFLKLQDTDKVFIIHDIYTSALAFKIKETIIKEVKP